MLKPAETTPSMVARCEWCITPILCFLITITLLGSSLYLLSITTPKYVASLELEEIRLVAVTIDGTDFTDLDTLAVTSVGGVGSNEVPFLLSLPIVDSATGIILDRDNPIEVENEAKLDRFLRFSARLDGLARQISYNAPADVLD